MRLNITLEQALEKASPILREKMNRSVELIKKAEKLSLLYDAENGFWLAHSGGKDSQALYHITELSGVKFKAHFSPTTVDPPQVIRFIRTQYPDCEFGKVSKNIYDMAVEKQILPTMRVRWCCAEYKEMAGAGKVTLIGIRHAESARRAKRNEVEVSNRKFSGDFEQFTEWQAEKIKKKYKNLNQDQFSYDKEQTVRCISGKDSILVSPIIDWEEGDVWEFLNKVCEVPHCELYDMGYHRIGCILCPMSNYKQKLRECRDFPYVKAKWIDAIKRIRMGGVSQDKLTCRQGGASSGTTAIGRKEHQSQRADRELCTKSSTIRGGADSKFRIPKQWMQDERNFRSPEKQDMPTSTGTVRNGLLQVSKLGGAVPKEVKRFARKQRYLERRWIARQWGLSLMMNLKTRLRRIYSFGG